MLGVILSRLTSFVNSVLSSVTIRKETYMLNEKGMRSECKSTKNSNLNDLVIA